MEVTSRELAESYYTAEMKLRMVIYGSVKELAGYQSAKEVITILLCEKATQSTYKEKKLKALEEALSKVKGYPYLKTGVVTRIATSEDVEGSIKELLRASGIMSSVDDFLIEMIS